MARPLKLDTPLTYEELRILDTYLVGVEQSQNRARRKEDVGLPIGRSAAIVDKNKNEVRTILGKVVHLEELND